MDYSTTVCGEKNAIMVGKMTKWRKVNTGFWLSYKIFVENLVGTENNNAVLGF